jgi:hypothetical protein
MSISETFRVWLLQPILDQIKKTEATIMADTAKDVDAETAKLAGLLSTTATDVLAAIADLKAAVAAGATDLTPQVAALTALEKPLQDLDAAAQAVTAPAPQTPAA